MNVIGRKPSSHHRSHSARAMRISTAVILCVATAPLVTPGGPAAAVTIGGFEIDGDMVSSGALDWASAAVAPQPRSRDLVQSPLDDSFIAGSTSKELEPGNWDLQQAAGQPGANDVGDLYSFGAYDAATDHQFAFIGFERAAVGGSIAFNLELNQKRNTTNQNGVSVPNRSVGDILVDILAASGSSLVFGDVHTWTGREWDPMPGATGIVGAVNTAPITDVDGNTVPAGRFAELSIDLTALFPDVGSCPGISLQATNLRSRSSGSSITSTLKDWVDPGTITTPTSCGGAPHQEAGRERGTRFRGQLLGQP